MKRYISKIGIRNISPGPLLSAIVAINIMGWIPVRGDFWPGAMNPGTFNCSPEEADGFAFEYPCGVQMPDGKEYCSRKLSAWNPGEVIADAWEVVDKIGDCLHLRQHNENGVWTAHFCLFVGLLFWWCLYT